LTRTELFNNIKAKGSFLCVGLDTDPDKIPRFLQSTDDPVFEFNQRIIDSTIDHCVAYKPNMAFYEASGPSGWESLHKTMEFIPEKIFTIADAKRGDIGNTSEMYAKAFFDKMGFDAITLSPYMGFDSVDPYLRRDNHWAILLALTSNPGSSDFQLLETVDSKRIYETVIEKGMEWGTPDNTMFVVGATHIEYLTQLRELAKEYFFLVPGVGTQGGSLREVAKAGMNSQCGLLVNSSRSIIYASGDRDFDQMAGEEAKKIASEMKQLLDTYL